MQKVELKQIALVFGKLGIIGFGGPAAHIAMMREEVVIRRNWMSEQHFLDLLGATNLIPGPNSTEMAIHIGYDKAGYKGLLLAGICFILPAVLLTGLFAYLYKTYGDLPQVTPLIKGIQCAIIAIVIGAIYPLAKKSIQSLFLALLAIFVLVASLLGVSELILLFGSGVVAYLLFFYQKNQTNTLSSVLPLSLPYFSIAS